ncbi:hypothetical protein GCM10010266_40090 [Streptomyces griseomycini]|nr:hypothetical protein GCM10010266_40090 [Streptomyces griseomycini]
MRFGLRRDLREIRQDPRRATPRSTGALAAARARSTVFSVGAGSCGGLRSMSVASQGPPPWWAGRHPHGSQEWNPDGDGQVGRTSEWAQRTTTTCQGSLSRQAAFAGLP